MDDQTRLSPDDVLEPDDPTIDNITNQKPVPQDNDRPAAPADDEPGAGMLPPDSQLTDADMDEDEVYGEGVEAAVDVQPDTDEEDPEQ